MYTYRYYICICKYIYIDVAHSVYIYIIYNCVYKIYTNFIHVGANPGLRPWSKTRLPGRNQTSENEDEGPIRSNESTGGNWMVLVIDIHRYRSKMIKMRMD